MASLRAVCFTTNPNSCMQMELAINSGDPNILKPRKTLHKAFLKMEPNRTRIEQFKENLIELPDSTNDTEIGGLYKNLVTKILIIANDSSSFIDSKTDTFSLEAGIEQLVYRLYGLKVEQFRIVEGSMG